MHNRALGSSFLRAFLAERAITIATRGFIDIPMLAMLVADSSATGIARMLAIMVPANILLCVLVVITSDTMHARGIDLTGLEDLKTLKSEPLGKNQYFKRLVRWVLNSPRLVFWIGSWFYLDPDYVTLMLRKRGVGYPATFLRLTVPSVLLAMAVWTPIYWAAAQGIKWAIWLVA